MLWEFTECVLLTHKWTVNVDFPVWYDIKEDDVNKQVVSQANCFASGNYVDIDFLDVLFDVVFHVNAFYYVSDGFLSDLEFVGDLLFWCHSTLCDYRNFILFRL